MYFKYRSLSNFSRFVDILVNKRLYAAKYQKLNDPTEGFLTSELRALEPKLKIGVEKAMDDLRIVSLAKCKTNPIMWAHYADGFAGVAIGVSSSVSNQVKYGEDPVFFDVAKESCPMQLARKALLNKHKNWAYEGEMRILVTNQSYAFVKIYQIILGPRVPEETKDIICSLVDIIDDKIEIYQADFDENKRKLKMEKINSEG